MFKNFSEIYNSLSNRKTKKRVVVAAANDTHVLKAVMAVRDKKIIEPILVGDKKTIHEIADENSIDIAGAEIVNEKNPDNAAIESVKIIREGKGDILVKGFLETSPFLRPILNKKTGLRRGGVFSSICLTELENYHKIFGMTDPAINIAPDINTKIAILKNSIYFMRKLGIERPRVAVIAAIELVSLKMQQTIDAAILSKMAERDQIRNCYIEGPLSFDNAISKTSADHKGLNDVVSGDADILLLPNLEAANSLYKSMIHFGNATTAGIILGATIPIVVTSRTDPEEIKINSIIAAASVDFD